MRTFLSCDWGTSTFRLRLVRSSDLHILAETTHAGGIADTYQRWAASGRTAERFTFYATILQKRIKQLAGEYGQSLAGIPVVLSGMASSSIGMKELPYQPLPIHTDGRDMFVERLQVEGTMNPTIIISGITTGDDVMRGEETKILGCSSLLAETSGEQLVLLPGTHAKHAVIRQGKIIRFNTHMTGEFFKLLSEHSVLATSVEKGGDFDAPANRVYFRKGVETGSTFGLLHSAFHVRTNQLLKDVPKTANFYYLSGLLIGYELRDIPLHMPVYLVSGAGHQALYQVAMEQLRVPLAATMDADSALIAGQYMMLSRDNW